STTGRDNTRHSRRISSAFRYPRIRPAAVVLRGGRTAGEPMSGWPLRGGVFMAVIRDMMPVFELLQPASIDEALSPLDQQTADPCVAVSPSDTAPALVALDAEFVIRSAGGERVVKAEDYFLGPQIDIMHMTVLRPGELLTAIRIPATWAGAQFYFEKVRDRNVWDFPLVNVASAMKVSGTTISELRLVVGAVAARPYRLAQVEQAIAGKPRNAETAELA